MNRQPVKSSQIKSVGHNAATNTLEIEFTRGGVYQYSNVTPADYEALMGVGKKPEDNHSIGSHFLRNIKPQASKFPFKKIEAQKPA